MIFSFNLIRQFMQVSNLNVKALDNRQNCINILYSKSLGNQ